MSRLNFTNNGGLSTLFLTSLASCNVASRAPPNCPRGTQDTSAFRLQPRINFQQSKYYSPYLFGCQDYSPDLLGPVQSQTFNTASHPSSFNGDLSPRHRTNRLLSVFFLRHSWALSLRLLTRHDHLLPWSLEYESFSLVLRLTSLALTPPPGLNVIMTFQSLSNVREGVDR
jgi:hypothetical protein